MSWFIEEYISRELRDIVQLSTDSHEDSGGYQTETKTEVVVARISDGSCVRISAKLETKFGPNGGRKFIFQDSPISEKEYADLALRGTPIDLSSATTALAAEATLTAQKKEARALLLSTAPRCTIHDLKMKMKRGPSGEFWGCTKYPACRKTHALTPRQQLLSAESRVQR